MPLNTMPSRFIQKLNSFLLDGLTLETRVTPEVGYFPGKNNHIKREDELSAGISGCKYRKLASIFHFYQQGGYEEIRAVGGAFSNNLPGIAQFCNEKKIPLTVFIPGRKPEKIIGNYLWLNLLLEEEKIHFLPGQTTSEVEEKLTKNNPGKVLIIPEGGLMPEALPGALTLPADILNNEKLAGQKFEHIFIDSGTGMTAIGLILGFEAMSDISRHIHITFMAEPDPQLFIQKLNFFRKKMEELFDLGTTGDTPDLSFSAPPTARSFGAVNKTIMKEAGVIARETGILADPVYSVKHFMAARKKMEELPADASTLFIMNGGALGLAGFQDKAIPG